MAINMKVSVIMASHLGKIIVDRSDMDKKFIRAVNSFLSQDYLNKELIIVSDGCEKTNKLYVDNFSQYQNIKIYASPKQIPYAGGIRQIGLKLADGDIISYLDNDDVIGKTHLNTIVSQFDINEVDMVYYDDFLVLTPDFKKFQRRNVETRWASIGTSTISHVNFYKYQGRLKKEVQWYHGYGHDYMYMSKLIMNGARFKKLEKSPQYLVAHYGGADF